MKFKKGDKVICMGSFKNLPYQGAYDPSKGSVYTVREAFDGAYGSVAFEAIRLEEIVGRIFGIAELGFEANAFMLLSEFEASMATIPDLLAEGLDLINQQQP